jgi:hypothetical protein
MKNEKKSGVYSLKKMYKMYVGKLIALKKKEEERRCINGE